LFGELQQPDKKSNTSTITSKTVRETEQLNNGKHMLC